MSAAPILILLIVIALFIISYILYRHTKHSVGASQGATVSKKATPQEVIIATLQKEAERQKLALSNMVEHSTALEKQLQQVLEIRKGLEQASNTCNIQLAQSTQNEIVCASQQEELRKTNTFYQQDLSKLNETLQQCSVELLALQTEFGIYRPPAVIEPRTDPNIIPVLVIDTAQLEHKYLRDTVQSFLLLVTNQIDAAKTDLYNNLYNGMAKVPAKGACALTTQRLVDSIPSEFRNTALDQAINGIQDSFHFSECPKQNSQTNAWMQSNFGGLLKYMKDHLLFVNIEPGLYSLYIDNRDGQYSTVLTNLAILTASFANLFLNILGDFARSQLSLITTNLKGMCAKSPFVVDNHVSPTMAPLYTVVSNYFQWRLSQVCMMPLGAKDEAVKSMLESHISQFRRCLRISAAITPIVLPAAWTTLIQKQSGISNTIAGVGPPTQPPSSSTPITIVPAQKRTALTPKS